MTDHPLVGARVLARTPDHFCGIPTLQQIIANVPRIEAGVITEVSETAFGATVYVLIDGKERPEPFARSAIEIIPERRAVNNDD